MPRVPTYQPQLTPQALRGGDANIRVPQGAFGDASGLIQVGQALGQFGDRFNKTALETKAEEDKRAAKEAYIQFKNALRPTLYDPASGLFVQQGENAKGTGQRAEQELEKLRKEHTKGLTNNTQNELFSRFFDSDYLSTMDNALKHEAVQMREVDKNLNRALADDALQDMIAASSPEDFAKGRKSLEAAAQESSRLEGWSAEQREAYVADKVSTAHVNRVGALIAQEDYKAAREYMDTNAEGIKAEARAGLEAKVKDGEQARQAFDIGVRVFNGMPGESLSAKIAAAREEAGGDFDVEKSAVNWVKSLHSEQERAQREYRDQVENAFRDAALGAATPEQLHELETKALEIRDPKAREKALAAVRAGGKSPETTSPDKLAQAEQDVAAGMPAKELEAKYWKSLNSEDMKRLTKRIGKVDGERASRYMLTLKQQLPQYIPGKSKKATERRNVFAKQMDQYIDEYAAQNDGRYPSDKELSDHRDFLFKEVVYDAGEGLFNMEDSAPRYMLGTVDPKEYDIKEVEDALKAKGWTPDKDGYDAMRQALYRSYFNSKRGE